MKSSTAALTGCLSAAKWLMTAASRRVLTHNNQISDQVHPVGAETDLITWFEWCLVRKSTDGSPMSNMKRLFLFKCCKRANKLQYSQVNSLKWPVKCFIKHVLERSIKFQWQEEKTCSVNPVMLLFSDISSHYEFLQQYRCMSICLCIVLNVNQTPADSAGLSCFSFVCLNSAQNLLTFSAEIPPHVKKGSF